MSIWSSINCPTVICLPTIFYFSREKPLVKTTAPGSLLYYIRLHDLFYLLLFPGLLIQKPKNTSLSFICRYSICIYQIISLPIFYPGGIDNPSYASGCKYLFFVHCLLLDWYLGSQKLREILTLLYCITLSSSRENQRNAQEVASTSCHLA